MPKTQIDDCCWVTVTGKYYTLSETNFGHAHHVTLHDSDFSHMLTVISSKGYGSFVEKCKEFTGLLHVRPSHYPAFEEAELGRRSPESSTDFAFITSLQGAQLVAEFPELIMAHKT